MTDELTRKVMANLSGRQDEKDDSRERVKEREEEKNFFQCRVFDRVLDPKEEILLVERIYAAPEVQNKGIASRGSAEGDNLLPQLNERKTMNLRDLAAQKRY
jgi:hypothetical protein